MAMAKDIIGGGEFNHNSSSKTIKVNKDYRLI